MLVHTIGFALAICLVLLPAAALGQDQSASPGQNQPAGQNEPAAPGSQADLQQRLKVMENEIQVLSEEIQKFKLQAVIPEQTTQEMTYYGLGPAASKVYRSAPGLAIGGYGEAWYTNFLTARGHPNTAGEEVEENKNFADLERFVLYVGYKFTDRIVLNSEIEFEHAKTEATLTSPGGTVEVEFAYLDFRLWDQASARAGLLLMPMGWVNELHEPPIRFGNNRPEVETRIIPTTWREYGAGLYGALLPGLVYRTYVVNSLNAKGFTSSDIRDSTSEGNRAPAGDLAWTGRLDYSPFLGTVFGASYFWGRTGQDQEFAGRKVNPEFFLYDLHAWVQYRGLYLRALYTEGFISDATTLSLDQGQPVSHRIWGAYGEVAYDLLPLLFPGTRQALAPFVRIEWVDTQADVPSGFAPIGVDRFRVDTIGLSYWPIPTVVLKADYRQFHPRSGSIANEVNVGLGFEF